MDKRLRNIYILDQF